MNRKGGGQECPSAYNSTIRSRSSSRRRQDSPQQDEQEAQLAMKNNTIQNKPNYTYNSNHKGPFMVYADKISNNGEKQPINAISLNKYIINNKIPDITDIKKIGFGRCRLLFKNGNAANKFCEITHGEYEGKIFAHFISKIGIIFDIPTEISEDELLKDIISPVNIKQIIRITRKVNDEVIPTRRIKIIFEGLEIPTEIIYSYTKIQVKPFISFGQCYNCLRFNHFSKHCKQQKKICAQCGQSHELNNKCNTISCTNCEGNHSATDKNCPARIKAYTIKKIMTLENITQMEARLKYSNIFGNRFSILKDNTTLDTEFPQLPTGQKRKLYNNATEAAKHIHQQYSYAKVTKINTNRNREESNANKTMADWKKLTQENIHTNKHAQLAFPTEIQQLIQKQDDLATKINHSISNFLTTNPSNKNTKDYHDMLIKIQNEFRQMNVYTDLWKINNETLNDNFTI
ncbi:uncharacterized protein LOC128920493 [Zeugodacus cucurbitae]|uniref:uncharacterized protein LOC128920493 n=1 Tax=Zeugodacus cucurbitae TaxID=28588 RepID=UPI0023D9622C|nr:uncharacterized protein LOC128920493 [Zeugodacus cucurbitae]